MLIGLCKFSMSFDEVMMRGEGVRDGCVGPLQWHEVDEYDMLTCNRYVVHGRKPGGARPASE